MSRSVFAAMRYAVSIDAHLANPTLNEISGLAASIRFYALVTRGPRLRRDDRRRELRLDPLGALFVAMSALACVTFISFIRARTCGVRPRKDATGVKPLICVADPYAGVPDEPIVGGGRISRAQRVVLREIDRRKTGWDCGRCRCSRRTALSDRQRQFRYRRSVRRLLHWRCRCWSR